MHLLRVIAGLLLVALCRSDCIAEIYSQFPANTGFSMSDADPAAAWNDEPQYVANDVVLSETTQVTLVRWWGRYMTGNPMTLIPTSTILPPSNFTIRIFNDSAGSVGSLNTAFTGLGSGNKTLVTLTGTSGAYSLYEFSYSLPTPKTLNGGTRYWVSIFDNTSGFPNDSFFSLAKSSSTGWMFTKTVGGQSGWINVPAPNNDHAFQLVPEPSTYAMAVAGLACGGYSLFRRRKRA